mgnify:CR=1 FL=1
MVIVAVALVAVAALLVGALLPVLFQLVITLKAVRAVVEQAGPVRGVVRRALVPHDGERVVGDRGGDRPRCR